jgi:hypothetical protein
MIEEWKSYSRYTKTVLTIYLILSLPLLPVMIPMVLFCFWVAKPKGDTRKMPLADVISLSFTMSLFVYIMVPILHGCPPK